MKPIDVIKKQGHYDDDDEKSHKYNLIMSWFENLKMKNPFSNWYISEFSNCFKRILQ
jgi:hypothetical protein